jgi:hypothetical protein
MRDFSRIFLRKNNIFDDLFVYWMILFYFVIDVVLNLFWGFWWKSKGYNFYHISLYFVIKSIKDNY